MGRGLNNLLKSIATRDRRGRNRTRRCNVSSILSQYARKGKHTLGMGMAEKGSHSRCSHLFQEKALSGQQFRQGNDDGVLTQAKMTATRNTIHAVITSGDGVRATNSMGRVCQKRPDFACQGHQRSLPSMANGREG